MINRCKLFYIISVGLILSVNVSKAMTDEEILDKEVFLPLVQLILENTDIRLNKLNAQHAYMQRKIQEQEPQILNLEEQEVMLRHNLNVLANQLYEEENSWRAYVDKGPQEAIKKQMNEVKANINEIYRTLNAYEKQKTILR